MRYLPNLGPRKKKKPKQPGPNPDIDGRVLGALAWDRGRWVVPQELAVRLKITAPDVRRSLEHLASTGSIQSRIRQELKRNPMSTAYRNMREYLMPAREDGPTVA